MKANPASALPHYYLGKILISDDRFGTRPDLAGAKVAYEKAVRYGHGEVREKAKSDLLYVASELAKAKPASETVAPTP